MSLIFLNACVRDKDSRTLKIARNILNEIDASIEEIDLSELDLVPYTKYNHPVNNPIKEEYFTLSRKIAESDGLIIAAPFWDMSFPSLLKVFLEKLSIADIMFKDNGVTCEGIAKCPFMFYITTRGMDIKDDSPLEQATPYLKALCHLWGIKKFDYISAYNLDYTKPDVVEKLLKVVSNQGIKKLKQLL